MSSSQGSAGAPNPAAPAQPAGSVTQPTVAPNQYHLHGGGISITYYPEGFSPVQLFKGRTPSDSRTRMPTARYPFTATRLRAVDVPDLGTVVSVTLVRSVDTGATTFGSGQHGRAVLSAACERKLRRSG